MKEATFAPRRSRMPLTSPAFKPGPYRSSSRVPDHQVTVTDPERLRADRAGSARGRRPVASTSSSFLPGVDRLSATTPKRPGHPVTFPGQERRLHPLHVPQRRGPIAGGRELWAFRELAIPAWQPRSTMLVGTSTTDRPRATGTM